jgi:type I restriction enzyme S subunit
MPSFDYDRDGIVLSAIGARCGLTWYARGKWSCIKNTIRFWSADIERACNEFLFIATSGIDFWPRRGAAQPVISLGDSRAITLLIPSNELMSRFREVAQPALGLIDSLERKNANLRTTRDLLLPKLISGELDVSALPEPEAVAA